jgi:2-keto-4-pentenoate hydratase/2-oxohepta-3-ene-1,7-dioic acid hydratase in catechol pathway
MRLVSFDVAGHAPWGQRKPPVWLKPGDITEVEIERIGLLRNTVIAEAGA